MPAAAVDIPILCFNDVYRVNQRYVPQPGAPSTSNGERGGGEISVSQFGQLVYDLRDRWARSPRSNGSSGVDEKAEGGADGEGQGWDEEAGERGKVEVDGEEDQREGLILFAGDVFNPSVESSVTRGSHMVPVMNALKVDCACVGNHDFDFGFPHLTKLIESTTFPWLLSNIIDSTTGKVPEPLKRYWVTRRCGVKIGVVGLVEEDWIATIPSWPETFQYRPMKETALEISKELREEQGVEVIIALTHCRVPNDIKLAKELGAVDKDTSDQHGVDLLIGGHDHIYYIGKGATEWDGWAGDRSARGTEGDDGVRLIKSGTDFRDLSSATLTLSPPSEKTRRRRIESLKGKHHYILPSSPTNKAIEELLKTLLSSVSSTLSRPVCWSLTPFDARSEIVRTQESGLGNWVADVLMHAYAESLLEKGPDRDGQSNGVLAPTKKADGKRSFTGVDAVIICGGTLRGDSQYGPGKITLGDILEILPFEDPVVCIEIDGKGIWDTIESALSKWPAQEGRFPIVSGLQVQWDHSLPPGKRVKSIKLVNPPDEEDDEIDRPEDMVDFVEQDDGTRIEVKNRHVDLGEDIKNEEGGRKYRVITREYMSDGYDGFSALKGRKFIIDDETGQIMSSIIRSFLLGSAYIFRHKQLAAAHEEHLSSRTSSLISRARNESTHMDGRSPIGSPHLSKLGLRSPTHEKEEFTMPGSPVSEKGSTSQTSPKRHVVNHSWSTIRAALWIAKNEHMSAVDECKGSDLRSQGYSDLKISREEGKTANGGFESQAQASYFVNEESKKELKALGDDLAIVCPLVDGRMKDLAA